MYQIGVDIGGSSVKAGITGADRRILVSASVPTRVQRGPAAVVEDVLHCIDLVLQRSGMDARVFTGIGVGSPGLCDCVSGVVSRAYNLGWHGVAICRIVSERYALPVYLANDANCAALGETLAGAAAGKQDVLMVTLGTGIGSGVVIGGKIYAGWRSLGGELGHMCIAMDGARCSCGERGCWEAYASATALIGQALDAAAADSASLLNSMKPLDGKKIFEAAEKGDETAQRVTQRYCRYVATGLVNAVNLLYPEMIVLGGGVSRQGERLLAPVREYVAEHFFAGRRACLPELAAAGLGSDAGIIGAAALAAP